MDTLTPPPSVSEPPPAAVSPFPDGKDRLTGALDLNTYAIGILGRDELLLVPRWVIRQLFDPQTPGRLRQAGSEQAREYLRDMYGVDGELTVFWWGSQLAALEYAARHLRSFVPPAACLTDAAVEPEDEKISIKARSGSGN